MQSKEAVVRENVSSVRHYYLLANSVYATWTRRTGEVEGGRGRPTV